MNQKRHRTNNTAFTIIELLVVISIIALLISILLPSLAGARDLARFIKWKGYSHNLRIDQSMVTYYNFEEQGNGEELWNRAAGNPFDQAREDFEPEMLNGEFKDLTNWNNSNPPTNPAEWYTGTNARWKGKGTLHFGDPARNFVETLHHDFVNPVDQPYSVMLWSNLYSGADVYAAPVSSRLWGPPHLGYNLYASTATNQWEYWTMSGGGFSITAAAPPAIDNWTLAVATYEPTGNQCGHENALYQQRSPGVEHARVYGQPN